MVKQKTVLDGNKRKDASVTMHSLAQLPPHQQWEMNVNPCPEGIPNDPAGAFLPMSGTKRPQPHKKINECDH